MRGRCPDQTCPSSEEMLAAHGLVSTGCLRQSRWSAAHITRFITWFPSDLYAGIGSVTSCPERKGFGIVTANPKLQQKAAMAGPPSPNHQATLSALLGAAVVVTRRLSPLAWRCNCPVRSEERRVGKECR